MVRSQCLWNQPFFLVLQWPVQTLLLIVRECHAAARAILSAAEPDFDAAEECMWLAIDAGEEAAPYIKNAELRRRIVSGMPMFEEEWDCAAFLPGLRRKGRVTSHLTLINAVLLIRFSEPSPRHRMIALGRPSN
jgi:hypothetical protein